MLILNNAGEQFWLEFHQHVTWSTDFSLIFLFSSDARIVNEIKARLRETLQKQAKQLDEYALTSSPEWLNQTLTSLLQPETKTEPVERAVWLGFHYPFDDTALEQYRALLIRLNERRESLRQAQPHSMIIILPESFHGQCHALVPDLWAIRTWSFTLTQNHVATQPIPQRFPLNDFQQGIVDEWHRLEALGIQGGAYRVAISRASDAFLRAGWLVDAAKTADINVAEARKIAPSGTPSADRNLSIALNTLGDAVQQQGRWQEAEQAFSESLRIARHALMHDNKNPETRHHLSACLLRMGDIAQQQNHWQAAEHAFSENLDTVRGLLTDEGETDETLRHVSTALDKTGGIAQQQERWQEAEQAFAESLQIRRRLWQRVGETPEVLRDLSTMLEKVGDIAHQQSRWQEAKQAFSDSLQIRQRLRQRIGETPETLRDLSRVLQKVEDIAKQSQATSEHRPISLITALRPQLTQNLLRYLQQGRSLNLIGSDGQGCGRLLADLREVALVQDALVLHADMSQHARSYNTLWATLWQQCHLTNNTKPKNRADVAHTVTHALTAEKRPVWLLLHRFDTLHANASVDPLYNQNFLNFLNALLNKPGNSLLITTKNIKIEHLFLTYDKQNNLSPLEMEHTWLPPLGRDEIMAELQRELPYLKPDDIEHLIQVTRLHPASYTFLRFLMDNLAANVDVELVLSERLIKWQKNFNRLECLSNRHWNRFLRLTQKIKVGLLTLVGK